MSLVTPAIGTSDTCASAIPSAAGLDARRAGPPCANDAAARRESPASTHGELASYRSGRSWATNAFVGSHLILEALLARPEIVKVALDTLGETLWQPTDLDSKG
jgi:hypothetical protein